MPRDKDDGDLVARCLRGDPAAFRDLYRLHAAGVQGMLVRILGPRRDLEDLVQQVFLELVRALPRFRAGAPMTPFLLGIAVNVARRTLERGPRAPLELEADALVDERDPEAQAGARQLLERTFAALDRISAKKRIAFVLHVVEGRDVREIAALVRANEPAVRARIAAARREVEALLEEPS